MIPKVEGFGIVNKLVMVMVISYGWLHLSSYFWNYCITMRNETIKAALIPLLEKVQKFGDLQVWKKNCFSSAVRKKINWKNLWAIKAKPSFPLKDYPVLHLPVGWGQPPVSFPFSFPSCSLLPQKHVAFPSLFSVTWGWRWGGNLSLSLSLSHTHTHSLHGW